MGVLNVLHVWSRGYEVVFSATDTLTFCGVHETAELQYTAETWAPFTNMVNRSSSGMDK